MPYEIPLSAADRSTLILASKSPRRRELMELLETPFAVCPGDADETVGEGLGPGEIVSELSRRKCAAAAAGFPENIVIGADTIVWNPRDPGREAYGKPKDRADAVRMLSSLSGGWHEVWTGVTVALGDRVLTDAVRTAVRFRELSEEDINNYIDRHPPYDKAGAYAIQESAALFIPEIQGDFYNVIGLPVEKTYELIRKAVRP